jgi:lysophospholipase L1-like esterase
VKTQQRTYRARAFLYYFIVFVLFLIGVEILLSSTHLFGARKSWTSPDAVIGWRFEPNSIYWFNKENDHPISGRINNQGWRDHDRQLRKPAGTQRVAVLGDSYVEAFQVELDSTFTARMERLLGKALGQPVEVLNFGRSGMTQTEELLILQSDVVRYDPDVVVVVFLPFNDIDDISPATTHEPLRPYYHVSAKGDLVLDTSFANGRTFKLKRLVNPLKQRSALISMMAERYNLIRMGQRREIVSADAPQEHLGGVQSLCTQHPNPRYAENYLLNKRLIEEMARVCAREDCRFVLVCTDYMYKAADIDRARAIDPTFDAGFFDRDLSALADSLGVDYIGLQDVFAKRFSENGRPLHWAHWNYEGHRVVADTLSHALAPMLESK